MTREEAIDIINSCVQADTEEVNEALDMAVNALEQEPDAIHNEREQAYMKGYEDASKRYRKEPCEDAISRQATVERLCKVAEFMNEKRNGLGSPYVMAALFIQDNKGEFPSVTPKQKMGQMSKEKDARWNELEILKMDLENRIHGMTICAYILSEEEKDYLLLFQRCLSVMERIQPKEE